MHGRGDRGHPRGARRRLTHLWPALVATGLLAAGCSPAAPTDAPAGAGPSATPARTASPTPTPVVYPDETTTGVPPGVQLEPSDSLKITEPGTVVDGLEIRGNVIVTADDVVIRNTRIISSGGFPVRLDGGRNLLIEDSEIDGQGRGYAAVAFSKYTLRRVHIHHVTEGPRIAGGEVVIEESYIHSLVQKGDNHTDAVQLVGGSNVVVRGNTILAHNPETGLMGNAAFMFGEDSSEVRDCLVEGNLMNGGNYTVNGGGSGSRGARCTFRDNQFQRDFRYGTHANLGPGVVWEPSNTWYDTGERVR